MAQPGGTVLLGVLLFQIVSASVVRADPIGLDVISPFRLLASGGDVTVHFVASHAGYDSLLYFSRPGEEPLPLFENHSTRVGQRARLGTYAAGTELTFGLHVLDTGHHFFTGPASRNPDGVVHARAVDWGATWKIPTIGVLIGFEDLLNGGDRDFNDFVFLVSNVTVADVATAPEPATLLLVGSGVAALAARRRRRRG
jgi:hypothetical protein